METDPSIRQIIRRRVKWLIGMAALGWVLLIVSISLEPGPPWQPLRIAGLGLFFGAVVLMQLIKCPNCSSRLGQIGTSIGFAWRGRLGWRRQVKFCPYCGIDIDQPVPHKLTS